MTTDRLGDWMLAASPPALRPVWIRLRSSMLGARLARGAFWMVFGAAASRVLGLLSSILLARLLGQVRFGEFATIQSTAGLFGVFAGLGIGVTATKYVAELRESEPERCGRVVGFSLAAAVAGGVLAGIFLILFASPLAAQALAAPHLAPLLRMSALLVVFSALQGVYAGALSGFEAFRVIAGVSALSSIVGVPLVVLGAALDGLRGAIWGLTFQAALGCILAHRALRREGARAGVKISLNRAGYEGGLLWRFALPAFLSGMLATPAGWFSRALLANQPDGYAQAALVNAANQWMNLLTFLPWMMGGVLVPIFANLHAAGNRAKFRQLLSYNLWLNLTVGLAIAGTLVLVQSRILSLYGAAFLKGGSIFALTMFAGLFLACNSLLSRAMQSAGRAWVDLVSNSIWALAVVSGSWFLIPRYAGLGLVASHTAAAVALTIWQLLLLRKILR